MKQSNVQVFIDKAPSKEKKVCGNCSNFSLWGVHSGSCKIKIREKLDTQSCNRFKANGKSRNI